MQQLTHAQLLFVESINKMTDKERKALREEILAKDPKAQLPRNLYYNYSTQKWID